MAENDSGKLTRYKITLLSLIIFGIVSITVIGTDAYLKIIGWAVDFGEVSKMIITALIGFFVGMSAAYTENKKINGNG